MLSTNTCKGVHLIVKLPAISLQAMGDLMGRVKKIVGWGQHTPMPPTLWESL